jgi:hypothetical protein
LEILIKLAKEARPKYARFESWLSRSKMGKRLDWCQHNELKVEAFGFFCWALVVIGLVIEINGNNRARLIGSKENAVLVSQAEMAKRDAAEAKERTSQLDLKRVQLEKQIGDLNPRKQPVQSISATVRFLVKGDGYVHQDKGLPEGAWYAGLAFFKHSDVKQNWFALSATKEDVEMSNVLGGRTDREYVVKFHQRPRNDLLQDDPGLGKPAESFDEISSFGVSTTAMETNSEVLSGSVVVTVNASLTWEFKIAPQRVKYGMLTSQNVTNAENKLETRVWPVSVVPCDLAWTNLYDGK